MSKFDRAYEIFKSNGAAQADRKATIAEIAKELSVTEANAGVYFYKSIKKYEAEGNDVKPTKLGPISAAIKQVAAMKAPKEEKPSKRVAVPSKIESKHYDKLDPMTKAERDGKVIPDYVPDFLLSESQRKLRQKQNAKSE